MTDRMYATVERPKAIIRCQAKDLDLRVSIGEHYRDQEPVAEGETIELRIAGNISGASPDRSFVARVARIERGSGHGAAGNEHALTLHLEPLG